MNCNYKVKITDIQTKYKFKVFCTGYDDSEIKEKVDAIYQAFPKTTAEGETPTLDNTANATMSIDLKGNTSQETTTGKNSIGTNYITGVTVNDATTNDITIRNNWASTIVSNENLLKVLKPSTTYTISYKYKVLERPSEFGSNNSVYILGLYDGGSGLTFFGETQKNTIALNTWDTITKTFTTPASLTNYKMIAYDFKDANNTTAGAIELNELQIEKGSSATDYEKFTYGASPNPDYPQEVKNVTGDNTIKIEGKNLFGIKEWLDTLGVTYTENSDGSITFTPTSALYNTTYPIKETDRCMMSFKITNGNGTNFRFRYVYEDGTMTETTGSGTGTSEVSVATSSSVVGLHGNVIGIRGNWTIVGTFTIKECMLEQLVEGVSPQAYEPYQSQSYAVNLGTMELCKIGDYQDYIYKDNKKWYKYGAIGKAILDGSEEWLLSGNQYNVDYPYFLTSELDSVINTSASTGYMNYFKALASYTTEDNGFLVLTNNRHTRIKIYKGNLQDVSSLNATIESFKTWLSTHNTIFYYILATPVTTEITDTTLISQLNALAGAESYSGQTNISQTNDDKPFILTAKALKDLSNL